MADATAEYLRALLKSQEDAARGELGMIANQPDQLMNLMSQLFTADELQKLNAHQLGQAEKESETEQPGLIRTRDMTVAASPLANVAATWKQIKGGQDKGEIAAAMAQLLRDKSNASEQYHRYGRDQARSELAAQQGAQAQAIAQANEGIPGVSPQLQPDLGAGTPGQDMWHGEGRVPVASGDPQSGPRHDFGPYPPPGAPGQNATRRPRGYIPMPWEKAGPPRGNPWEE
jgi:hypothetical protein